MYSKHPFTLLKKTMTTCTKENLVEDVLGLVAINKEFLQRLPASETHGKECLEDMHTHLCELLSKMITAPLTGRVFLPSPEHYVSSRERLQSLQASFNN